MREFPKNIKGLKICHLNIRSLPAHIDELRLILDEYPFDILSLNETRLDDSIPDGEISINEYTIHRKDRDRDGGGVAILIRNCINYSKVSIPTPLRDLELASIQIPKPFSKPIIICSWYRPPDSHVDVLSKFEDFLKLIDSKDAESILLSDTNCNLLRPDSQTTTLSFFMMPTSIPN